MAAFRTISLILPESRLLDVGLDAISLGGVRYEAGPGIYSVLDVRHLNDWTIRISAKYWRPLDDRSEYADSLDELFSQLAVLVSTWWTEIQVGFKSDEKAMLLYMKNYMRTYAGRGIPVVWDERMAARARNESREALGPGLSKSDVKELVRAEMPPQKKPNGKEPAPPEAEEAVEEAEAEPVLKNETGDEVVQNLLAHGGRIATPSPNKPYNLWVEWTCLHCHKTYNPGLNFTKAVLFPSDVANAIVKHFREHHGSGSLKG